MKHFKSVIEENIFSNQNFLKDIVVLRTWSEKNLVFHEVRVSEDQIPILQKKLRDGPHNIYFLSEDDDAIIIAFKKKLFRLKKSDKASWAEAIAYGKSLEKPSVPCRC
jgi:hypothetical protein